MTAGSSRICSHQKLMIIAKREEPHI